MDSPHPVQTVPEIVRIVLARLGTLHAAHDLADAEYQAKLDRLVREELTPRNLCLLERQLQDGSMRYIIKDHKGGVCDLVECAVSMPGASGGDDARGAEACHSSPQPA